MITFSKKEDDSHRLLHGNGRSWTKFKNDPTHPHQRAVKAGNLKYDMALPASPPHCRLPGQHIRRLLSHKGSPSSLLLPRASSVHLFLIRILFEHLQAILGGASESEGTSISIQGYVDLGLFAKTVEKDSSIDLSPIDSGFSRYPSR